MPEPREEKGKAAPLLFFDSSKQLCLGRASKNTENSSNFLSTEIFSKRRKICTRMKRKPSYQQPGGGPGTPWLGAA